VITLGLLLMDRAEVRKKKWTQSKELSMSWNPFASVLNVTIPNDKNLQRIMAAVSLPLIIHF
jgi:hypothetical protein